MQIARTLFENKPSDLFPRLRCPALLCPADPPRTPPPDPRSLQFLELKRAGAARAEQASPLVRTVWFRDTVHDIPLHRPAELAQTILAFESELPSVQPSPGS